MVHKIKKKNMIKRKTDYSLYNFTYPNPDRQRKAKIQHNNNYVTPVNSNSFNSNGHF